MSLFIGPSLIFLYELVYFFNRYTGYLGTTLYLMLPMFNGADVVFRNILVPIAGQREALLLKDAKMLAKSMVKQLPASRHGEAGEAIAEAFLVEAKMQK